MSEFEDGNAGSYLGSWISEITDWFPVTFMSGI